jgi:hypothetical protein
MFPIQFDMGYKSKPKLLQACYDCSALDHLQFNLQASKFNCHILGFCFHKT